MSAVVLWMKYLSIWLWYIGARLFVVASPQSGYTPAIHSEQAEIAFEHILTEDPHGPLMQVLARYEDIVPKETSGTCRVLSCYASRGPTDCFQGKCICREGYGTFDGAKCVPASSGNQHIVPKQTSGTCRVFPCHASRGPTDCIRGKCICRKGYGTFDGAKCVPVGSGNKHYLEFCKRQLLELIKLGAGEPDNSPCPGSQKEMMSQAVQDVLGVRIYNMSLCRTAIQVYHGSPLPLVYSAALADPPIDNGYEKPDNLVGNLYSVQSFRQWRSEMLLTLANEFAISVLLSDVSDSGRRLGNIFHTFSDSFSNSHVIRKPSSAAKASRELCEALSVTLPISMDVVNWLHHLGADSARDIFYKCAIFWEEKIIRHWAAVRLSAPNTTARTVNEALDSLISQVLCPALAVESDAMDKPAGGATAYYSSDSINQIRRVHPIMPRGLTTEADAQRIVHGWSSAVEAYHNSLSAEQARFVPQGLHMVPRNLDVCLTPSAAHVSQSFVQTILENKFPRTYWLPTKYTMQEAVFI